MERLTSDKLHINSILFAVMCNFIPQCGEIVTKEVTEYLRAVFDKLAELEDLEEQGLLVRVVRCKDCKHFIKVPPTGYTGCELHEHLMSTNGYCSWGELKESEDE